MGVVGHRQLKATVHCTASICKQLSELFWLWFGEEVPVALPAVVNKDSCEVLKVQAPKCFGQPGPVPSATGNGTRLPLLLAVSRVWLSPCQWCFQCTLYTKKWPNCIYLLPSESHAILNARNSFTAILKMLKRNIKGTLDDLINMWKARFVSRDIKSRVKFPHVNWLL